MLDFKNQYIQGLWNMKLSIELDPRLDEYLINVNEIIEIKLNNKKVKWDLFFYNFQKDSELITINKTLFEVTDFFDIGERKFAIRTWLGEKGTEGLVRSVRGEVGLVNNTDPEYPFINRDNTKVDVSAFISKNIENENRFIGIDNEIIGLKNEDMFLQSEIDDTNDHLNDLDAQTQLIQNKIDTVDVNANYISIEKQVPVIGNVGDILSKTATGSQFILFKPVLSVSGSMVDNTDPINPIIKSDDTKVNVLDLKEETI